jgi:lipoprotein-anchoring transpeptidase ErfK/SrfK
VVKIPVVTHWYVKVAGAACVAGALALILTMLSTSSPDKSSPSGRQVASQNAPTSPRRSAKALHSAKVVQMGVEPASLVATLTETAPDFANPGGPQTGTVPATWYGAPSALPVLAQVNGYLEVRLAQRPNGSTAWIASSAATLSSTPYKIVIDLTTERLMLYKAGQLLLTAPAGVGTTQDPTPTGNFFVVLFASSPSTAWGPFVVVTSGHSDAISDYEESGDAIVAIHGPLGADAAIGTTGARISHGCVRLHDVDLAQLRIVPVGSPVQIVN